MLNTDDIPVEKSRVHDQQIVHFSPNSFGGNHKHKKIEWLIGIGDLLFVWLDRDGTKHETKMHPNGEILLIEVTPYLPHAVINQSDSEFGVLFELADEKSSVVEKIPVLTQ